MFDEDFKVFVVVLVLWTLLCIMMMFVFYSDGYVSGKTSMEKEVVRRGYASYELVEDKITFTWKESCDTQK